MAQTTAHAPAHATAPATAQTRRHVIGSSVLGAGLLSALAACGPAGGSGEGTVKAGGSGKQVTLRVGARGAGVAGTPSWEEFQAAKKLFESKYPKITVPICSQPGHPGGCWL